MATEKYYSANHPFISTDAAEKTEHIIKVAQQLHNILCEPGVSAINVEYIKGEWVPVVRCSPEWLIEHLSGPFRIDREQSGRRMRPDYLVTDPADFGGVLFKAGLPVEQRGGIVVHDAWLKEHGKVVWEK